MDAVKNFIEADGDVLFWMWRLNAANLELNEAKAEVDRRSKHREPLSEAILILVRAETKAQVCRDEVDNAIAVATQMYNALEARKNKTSFLKKYFRK